MTSCPVCKAPVSEKAIDCFACGLIFEKWKARQNDFATPPSPVPAPSSPPISLSSWREKLPLSPQTFLVLIAVLAAIALFHFRSRPPATPPPSSSATPETTIPPEQETLLIALQKAEAEIATYTPSQAADEIEKIRGDYLSADGTTDHDSVTLRDRRGHGVRVSYDPNTVFLTKAIAKKDVRAILMAVKAGIYPDVIWEAVVAGGDLNARFVQALLRSGADPNCLLHGTLSRPLQVAVKANAPRITQLLLEAGAEVNATATNSSTSILIAAENGADACIPLLAAHGADIDYRDNHGVNALCLACWNMTSNGKTVLALMKAGATWDPHTTRQTPMMRVVRDGDKDLVEQALALHPPLNLEDPEGRTELDIAVSEARPCPECVELLLKAGSDPRHADRAGKTVTMRAEEAFARAKTADFNPRKQILALVKKAAS